MLEEAERSHAVLIRYSTSVAAGLQQEMCRPKYFCTLTNGKISRLDGRVLGLAARPPSFHIVQCLRFPRMDLQTGWLRSVHDIPDHAFHLSERRCNQ